MSEIRNVKCENKRNPLNVDAKQPRFSWQIVSEGKNLFQKSYRIIVKQGNGLRWDSGMVEDSRTFGIPYAGEELVSRTSYRYTVEVVLSDGEHVHSEENRFETVLFDYKEWRAKFIEPDMLPDIDCDPLQECRDKWAAFVQKYMSGEEVTEVFDPGAYLLTRPCHPYHPAVMMCRKFILPDHVEKARVYMTAHGIYEFYINGTLASDAVLEPEFTTYDKILKKIFPFRHDLPGKPRLLRIHIQRISFILTFYVPDF